MLDAKKNDNLPIYLISGFNLFTLAFYIISPYEFQAGNVFLSYFYIFFNISALMFGYFCGVRYFNVGRWGRGGLTPENQIRLFVFLIIFYLFTFLIKYAYLLKFEVLDVGGMIERLLIGVYNPKVGYKLSVENTRQATVSWSLFFLISIFNGLFLLSGFVLWDKLRLILKFCFVLFLGIDIFYWVGRGTNFGIIAFIAIFVLSGILKTKGVITIKSFAKYSIAFFSAFVSFSLIMYSRSEGAVDDIQIFSLPLSYVDENSPVLLIVPEYLHTTLLTIFSYLVQGYYHMSIAFDLDFYPTWFGGWNSSILSLYQSVGIDVAEKSYIYRLENFGVDSNINWHSGYTWIANDFSFYGVPFVIFMVGWFIGFSWIKSIRLDDFLSKIVFILLSGMMVFIFANNNFISYYFYTFIVVFPYWVYVSFFSLKK